MQSIEGGLVLIASFLLADVHGEDIGATVVQLKSDKVTFWSRPLGSYS